MLTQTGPLNSQSKPPEGSPSPVLPKHVYHSPKLKLSNKIAIFEESAMDSQERRRAAKRQTQVTMARSGRFMQPQGLASLTDEASQARVKSGLPHETPSPGKYSNTEKWIKHEPVHQNQVPRPNGLLK